MNIVWWNGPSRTQFDHIPRQQLEVGCNFIAKHRTVDHVCAYDRQVIDLIQPQPNTQYWTRRNYAQGVWQLTPAPLRLATWKNQAGFCSGTLALAVALNHGAEHIHIIGMDWQETNASVYDKEYTWRGYTPTKHSNDKLKFLRHVSEQVQVTIVHDRPRSFGDKITWVSGKEFLKLF